MSTTTRSLVPAPTGFHGDRYLLRLVERLARDARVFVETGSNVGSTLGWVARRFPHLECFACEPDTDAHAVAARHAAVRTGVVVHRETSQDFLARLDRDHRDTFTHPILAWLDAHDYGYAWPLRDEIAFLTRRFRTGFLLVDDFRVPHEPRFGFDAYDGQECSFEHVRAAISGDVAWRLYYPSYSQHTSPWHPLRGFGLVQFGPRGSALPRLDLELPDVCLHAESHGCSSELTDDPEVAFQSGDVALTVALLRAALARDASSPDTWNDLGTVLVHGDDGPGALVAFAEALARDPEHEAARANLALVSQAVHGTAEKPLPVAPGPWGRMVHRDAFADVRALCTSAALELPVIVDGGSNRGDTVARLRQLFPGSTIHAFEPLPDLARAIRSRFASDDRLVVHGAALGATHGLLRFHRLRSHAASSALQPSALQRRYQCDAADVTEDLDVLALPLRDAVGESIDVLKLDLQGGELDALRGLGERLSEVRVLLTEVEFTPLYAGQPLFADVDAFLRGAGFRLFHLYDVWSHPDGQVTSGDALYVNERYFS